MILEPGASVWFNAVLRGDNEPIVVGAGSNVQDGCVCHTDIGFPLTIGPDCTIGHMAILHGCTIGAGSLIGMGATVLNGAVIGRGRAGRRRGRWSPRARRSPTGVLVVGRPARVVRALTGRGVGGPRPLGGGLPRQRARASGAASGAV